jgi:hypothetical protein
MILGNDEEDIKLLQIKTRFSWLAEPLSLDNLKAALEQCNNSYPGLDGLRLCLLIFDAG